MEMGICYGGIPSRVHNNSMGIRGYDYVEFYVGSAKHVASWHAKAMGLDFVAYSGPETGDRNKISFLMASPVQPSFKILISSSITPDNYDIQSFTQKHGDGVKRWTVEVDDVNHTFAKAIKNGAVPILEPYKISDDDGFIEQASIKLYDSCEINFINYDNYKGLFRPGFEKPRQEWVVSREETNLKGIDHIVGNVNINEMDYWSSYINSALDFETFIHFGPGDISTQYSSLVSKVVRSKDDVIKNPINEPYEGIKISQIEEYIKEYRGSGIQHIAILTTDIIDTVTNLRKNGVEFLATPPQAYYDNIASQEFGLEEDIKKLQENGILIDVEGKGYLLQIFTKPIGDRPTFFYEIIQRRKGASGFGQGNFQALFEAIEVEQGLRGNLDRD
ncbi:4-hydroxyphenylpyruvate dioxygenase [Candidatus Kapabacteria bacterium]|nr:4-hydroxyphenylpyruvate dioxygenase [Candidatus Kapabacteria bacterium]